MSTAQPNHPHSRPAFPPLHPVPGTSTSAFQHYAASSPSTLSSPSPHSAPLPSPSSSYPPHQSFFTSFSPPPPAPQQQQQQQYAYHHAQQQQGQQAQHHHQQQYFPVQGQAQENEYRPERDGAGRTAGETSALLNEFALVAEAAKRAQMAVLMRDMEGVEL